MWEQELDSITVVFTRCFRNEAFHTLIVFHRWTNVPTFLAMIGISTAFFCFEVKDNLSASRRERQGIKIEVAEKIHP